MKDRPRPGGAPDTGSPDPTPEASPATAAATLAWATDLHLPHAGARARERLLEELGRAAAGTDAAVVTGDISTADRLADDLRQLRDAVAPVPLCVVLGNHDFYGGAISPVRDRVEDLARELEGLVYLSRHGVLSLAPDVALVGHDGWGDARLGDWDTTRVQLNDFRLIRDLAGLGRDARVEKLRALGDKAAAHLERTLRDALSAHHHAVVATHVPPFADAAWHEGGRSDPDWLPYFACRASGRAIRRVAGAHPERRVTVLCGHTHSGGEIRPAPNVRVRTGRAEYGRPSVDGVLAVG